MKEISVRLGGEVYLYKDKAPYTQSGHGAFGALFLDPDEDKVMCHECGEWFKSLGPHVSSAHGLTTSEYKKTHGMAQSTALVSESLREVRISSVPIRKLTPSERLKGSRKASKLARSRGKATGTMQNVRNHCYAQTLKAIKDLAGELHATPTREELEHAGISHRTIEHRFGSISRAMTIAGLEVRKKEDYARKYSDAQLLGILVNFRRMNDRFPSNSDIRRGLAPSRGTFAHRFGSWSRAINKAKNLAA